MLFLFVLPAAYCDVTDSVLFPTRIARVVTFVGGVAATTLIWCVVTPLWLLTRPGTLLSDGLLITSAITGLTNIGQFMPLCKFDGHFILANVAGHPGLFEESWQHLRTTFIRPWMEKVDGWLWGPGVALGAANALVLLIAAAYWRGYGRIVSYGVSAVLGYGVLSLFLQAFRGPLEGASYQRLKRDFAVYALIFLIAWLIVAVEYMWMRLVPALRGYGALIVTYLVYRSLQRNIRTVFGTGREVRFKRPLAWATAAVVWSVFDILTVERALTATGKEPLARMAEEALRTLASARFWRFS